MKSTILFLLLIFSFQSLASVALNEFTQERKIELSTRIYIGEVVGVVKSNDGNKDIREYIQLKVVESIFGNELYKFVNVVSDSGFPGSELGIKCIGGVYLLFLKNYGSIESNVESEIFLEPVNLRFSVYKVENGQVINFTDGNNLSVYEIKKMVNEIKNKN